MRNKSESGVISGLLISFVLVCLLLLGAVGFGAWAFSSRQDYKNNVEKKISAAVVVAKQQQSRADQANFTQEAKKPLKTYTGPQAYGSVTVQYPKTWSSYVVEQDSNSTPIDAYFQPDFVPDITNDANNFALHIQVVQQSYDQVLQSFQGQVQSKQVSVAPYALPKVPSVIGSRVDGQIAQNKNGSMVVLPLRDKTIEISTEAQLYMSDFNTNILPNLTFSP